MARRTRTQLIALRAGTRCFRVARLRDGRGIGPILHQGVADDTPHPVETDAEAGLLRVLVRLHVGGCSCRFVSFCVDACRLVPSALVLTRSS